MTDARFPDIHRVLLTVLEDLAGGAGHLGLQTPTKLAERLPFLRVRRTGGHSDRLSDFARVEIDIFDGTYAAAERRAAAVHEFVTRTRLRAGRAVVDRVAVDQAPVELPWSPQVRRFAGRYLFVCRRIRPQ
jgi:hypothetical protein